MREFKLAQLQEMSKNLEYCQKVIKVAMSSRINEINPVSTSKYEQLQDNCITAPSDYYYFRWENYGVEITRNRDFYTVQCTGFHPSSSFLKPERFITNIITYGKFKDLDTAKICFYKAIDDLFTEVIKIHQGELF